MKNAISRRAQRAITSSRISAGWAHDVAHYQFRRTSPREHESIPFADQRRPTGKLAVVALVFAVGLVLWVVAVALDVSGVLW